MKLTIKTTTNKEDLKKKLGFGFVCHIVFHFEDVMEITWLILLSRPACRWSGSSSCKCIDPDYMTVETFTECGSSLLSVIFSSQRDMHDKCRLERCIRFIWGIESSGALLQGQGVCKNSRWVIYTNTKVGDEEGSNGAHPKEPTRI